MRPFKFAGPCSGLIRPEPLYSLPLLKLCEKASPLGTIVELPVCQRGADNRQQTGEEENAASRSVLAHP